MRTLLLALLACGPEPVDHDCGPQRGLLVATSDYTVGALAMVEGEVLTDRIATVSGDPLVRYAEGAVFQANRGAGDSLRRYEPGLLCRPAWEVALDRKSNVHDVEVVDGQLWVANYGRPEITVHDLDSGKQVDSVDLSAFDEDGVPDAHDLIWVDGRLLVALQRFDFTVEPAQSTAGLVVELDPHTGEALDQWEVGGSPRLFAHPLDHSAVLVLTGTYGVADGGLSVLHPTTGALTLQLDEAVLGRDLEGLAALGEHAVVLAADFELKEGGGVARYCVDLRTFEAVEQSADAGWFVDAAAGDGVVWVGVRNGWGERVNAGLLAIDPATCAALGDTLPTALEPYSLTFVGER